ncbi:autophagy protein ATG9, partial [Ascoidea rubescens DSM 1968]
KKKLRSLDPKERAQWLWANIENLDVFLQDVYIYYLGNGFYSIILSKLIDLLTLVFIFTISIYLTSCINYSNISNSHNKLSNIQVDKCYSNLNFFKKILVYFFSFFLVTRLFQFFFIDLKKLNELNCFYKHLLLINEDELQTISWQLIVKKIILLKNQNAIISNVSDSKAKSRLDAHDIANRIMRKENYLIALYNKNILDLKLPLFKYLNLNDTNSILTKTLEWNISLCLFGFVFNEKGQLRSNFLKESHKSILSDQLKKRFLLAGFLNLFFSPLLVLYFLLLYFFRYFNEYKSNPSLISSRQYTPYSEWKLREFNELYHLFQRRLNLSVPEATKYIDQFPKDKTNQFMKFVSFVSGSFAAILGILAIFDPELGINFEITEGRTALFYIGVFGTIWAISHNSIPEDTIVFDPEASLRYVAQFTHHLPKEWDHRFHTNEVKAEFSSLFEMKIVLLIKELTSIILTPFILMFALTKSTDKIIDFFREFSVHINGLGYICTFAMFDFDKEKNLATDPK